MRPVQVRDRSVVADVKETERADPSDPRQVAAPFAGAVTVRVAVGDDVEAGQAVATIEAMKMEASITAPVAGRVSRIATELLLNERDRGHDHRRQLFTPELVARASTTGARLLTG